MHDQRSLFRKVQQLLGRTAIGPVDKALQVLDEHPAVKAMGTQQKSNLRGIIKLHDESFLDDIMFQHAFDRRDDI